jgi:ribosome-associated protein
MSSSKPSKSARKREYLALQELGERLIDLTDEQLDDLSLDERLLEAVRAAQGMKAHGALRRQKQLIGKLMREVDPQPISLALDALGQHDNAAKGVFRAAEKWRDRITAGGLDTLPDFFALTGGENRALREHVKAYEAEAHDKSRRLIRRRIFGEIHKELASKMQSTPR